MYYTLQTVSGEFLQANLRVGIGEPALLRIEERKIRIGSVWWNTRVIRYGELFLTPDFVRQEMHWRSEEMDHSQWFICDGDQGTVTIYTVHHRDEMHLSVSDHQLILTISHPFEWILQAA